MRRGIWSYLAKKMQRRLWGIGLLTLAQMGHALLGVMFALGTRGVIDGAVSGESGVFWHAVLCQAAIVAGILITLTVARFLKERLRAELERDWKQDLLRGLLRGDYAQVSAYHSGELLTRLNGDVDKVNEGVLSIIPTVAAMVTRLVAAAAVLGMLDFSLAVPVLLLGVIVILLTGFVRRKLKDLNKQVSHWDGKVSGFVQESMDSLLMIQSLDVSEEVARRGDDLLDGRFEIQRRRKTVTVLANTAVSLLHYGAGFVALVWCAGKIMAGLMTFGSLSAVIQLVNQLQKPFVELSGILPQYAALTAAAERLMELDAVTGDVTPAADREKLYENMLALEGQDLSFGYDRQPVLENVSFRVPKGAFAVVTGASGQGKSTLLKLLLGIYPPRAGQLRLQTPAGEIPLDRSARRLFAYTPQGNLLLSGTLRENLTLVRPEATEEEIQHALHVSDLAAVVAQLPQGLETLLGESGAGLSEGQGQRLAIARAVLSGAPVLLLDECTSALDESTEARVLQRLRQLDDRTCIIVTHRPGAKQLCDWQLHMENGQIRSTPMA